MPTTYPMLFIIILQLWKFLSLCCATLRRYWYRASLKNRTKYKNIKTFPFHKIKHQHATDQIFVVMLAMSEYVCTNGRENRWSCANFQGYSATSVECKRRPTCIPKAVSCLSFCSCSCWISHCLCLLLHWNATSNYGPATWQFARINIILSHMHACAMCIHSSFEYREYNSRCMTSYSVWIELRFSLPVRLIVMFWPSLVTNSTHNFILLHSKIVTPFRWSV